MHDYTPQPLLSGESVAFTVKVDSLSHACLISKEALQKLAALKNIDAADADAIDIFHAFEGTINGVARRLVKAKVPGTLLVMGPNSFSSHAT